jgi:hypothetical protein
MPMNLADFPRVSGLVVTRNRIQADLDEITQEHNQYGCGIEFWHSEHPERRTIVLMAGDKPRQWADDRLHQQFTNDLRVLLRDHLTKDLAFCDAHLAELGVEIDDSNGV